MRFDLRALCAIALVTTACGSRASKYPAPSYEEPVLPKWEPTEREEEDPFANLDEMEGEWVTDEDEGDRERNATPVEEPDADSEKVDGAGETPAEEPSGDGPPETAEGSDAQTKEKQPEEPVEPPGATPESTKK